MTNQLSTTYPDYHCTSYNASGYKHLYCDSAFFTDRLHLINRVTRSERFHSPDRFLLQVLQNAQNLKSSFLISRSPTDSLCRGLRTANEKLWVYKASPTYIVIQDPIQFWCPEPLLGPPRLSSSESREPPSVARWRLTGLAGLRGDQKNELIRWVRLIHWHNYSKNTNVQNVLGSPNVPPFSMRLKAFFCMFSPHLPPHRRMSRRSATSQRPVAAAPLEKSHWNLPVGSPSWVPWSCLGTRVQPVRFENLFSAGFPENTTLLYKEYVSMAYDQGTS